MADLQGRNPMDERPLAPRVHNILLQLAGRIDDSALSEARELSARLQPIEAVELVIGVMIAGRMTVTTAERTELAAIVRSGRATSSLIGHLLVDDLRRRPAHKFCDNNHPEQGVSKALQQTIEVLPGLRSVCAVWRTTPAGAVPGPLPQRMVLVETTPKANPTAVAFRMLNALRKAEIDAVVEVTGPTAELSEYQEVAMATGVTVWSMHDSVKTDSTPVLASPVETPRKASHGRHTAPAQQVSPIKAGVTHLRPHSQELSAVPLTSVQTELRLEVEKTEAATGRQTQPESGSHEIVELPDLDLDDPQLSERDRQLLRELRKELAEQAAVEMNDFANKGSGDSDNHGNVRWLDGFSSN